MTTATLSLLIMGLLLLQLAMGFAIIMSRNLLAAAMLSGAFSLLGACLFMVLDAADVAFTEAAVGAGISTALVLGALSLTNFRERGPRVANRRLGLLACAALLAWWCTLVPQMPVLGDPNSPVQAHPMTRYFIEGARNDIQIPNAVTAVLGSYRGFDTLGEALVIFTAGMVVFLLLGQSVGRREEDQP